jgi:hypothetical protein
MNLAVRRLLVVGISLALGLALTHASFLLAYWAYGQWITPEEYGLYFGTEGDGIAYYPLTILFFGLGCAIWLDKFLNTEILAK